MAHNTPFSQIVGAAKIYLAPYGTPEPSVASAPGAPWIEFGATEGEQTIAFAGALTYFRDNDHQGPVSAVRAEEDVNVSFTLVNSSLEFVSRVMHDVGKLTNDASPVPSRVMPFKRGAYPTPYAILFRGDFDSPYGAYPGHHYIPYVVSDAEPALTRAKDGRQSVECNFVAIEDDAQIEALRLGWSRVQTGV